MTKSSIKSIFTNHKYPRFLLRYPGVIHLHYCFLQILYTRSRISKNTLRKELLKLSEGDNILDLGCGEGQYIVPFLQKYKGNFFVGVDISDAHIDFLTAYIKTRSVNNFSVLKIDLDRDAIPYTEKFYDLIQMIGTLQYLNQPLHFLTKVGQLQSPGQKIIIYTPLQNRIELPFYRLIKDKFSHYDNSQNTYTQLSHHKLIATLRSSGYHIIKEKFCYGKIGRYGLEIYNTLLILFLNSNFIFKLFIFLFFIILAPIFVTLQVLDQMFPPKQGNSVLLVAEKT